jgi:hypothetical protein
MDSHGAVPGIERVVLCSSLSTSSCSWCSLHSRCNEEQEEAVASAEEEEEGEEAVATMGKGVGGCGEARREGRREDLFTART